MKTTSRLSARRPGTTGATEHEVRVPGQLTALLRVVRRQRGLTQRELARRLGITQQALSQLERHAAAASFERVVRYCRALGIALVLRDATPAAPRPAGADW